jgi:hypothetical protein
MRSANAAHTCTLVPSRPSVQRSTGTRARARASVPGCRRWRCGRSARVRAGPRGSPPPSGGRRRCRGPRCPQSRLVGGCNALVSRDAIQSKRRRWGQARCQVSDAAGATEGVRGHQAGGACPLRPLRAPLPRLYAPVLAEAQRAIEVERMQKGGYRDKARGGAALIR